MLRCKSTIVSSLLALASACTTTGPKAVTDRQTCVQGVPQAASAPVVPVVSATLLDGSEDADTLVRLARRLCRIEAATDTLRSGLAIAQHAASLAAAPVASQLVLSRCAYVLADRSAEPAEQLRLAELGARAAATSQQHAASTEAAYLRAVHLGLLMRPQGLDALKLLPELQRQLELAQAQPELDAGGPLRVLGMLYLQAPAWPSGPGDLEAALELLAEAAQRFPEHPLNHLYLSQALLEAGDTEQASTALQLARRTATWELWGHAAEGWLSQVNQAAAKLQPAAPKQL